MMLSEKQISQLHNLGIDQEQIALQLKYFAEGFAFAHLDRAATDGDGIFQISESDIACYSKLYDAYAENAHIVKFVPASGAATRMFKGLYEYIDNPEKSNEADLVLQHIEKFAFYYKLREMFEKKHIDIASLLNQKGLPTLIKAILEKNELNYGSLPKGLLHFHQYNDDARTAVDEHVAEAIQYATTTEGVKLHFTISPEHESLFVAAFKKLTTAYKKEHGINIDIGYSFQKKSTDTLAVDVNNQPLLDNSGLLSFRPGGHGALLENLNDLHADLIFIKNIDNVVPDYLKPVTVQYKKACAGLLIQVKQQIADYLNYLERNDTYSDERKLEIAHFMQKYLGIKVPETLASNVYAGYIKAKLDKPIRICGMVKNSGEPGGGPFWTLTRKGEPSLQIIESSQVDPNNAAQQHIMRTATHFNPVDLVCYVKDYTGNKFNLLKYRDADAGFITEKTIGSKKIKAMELPGLWNGSMAHWITIFVEVPSITFNPVKTILDLLRKEHQPG